jgi:hypothetical protein
MAARRILTGSLMAFVLVTIGFAVGMEVGMRRARRAAAETSLAADGLIVYYFHRTARCVTCNKLEVMARALLDREFADALACGRVVWKPVDFEQHEDLARRYDVTTSTVVLADVRGGAEVRFQRLDDLWLYPDDPDRFAAYVGEAIRDCLGGE